MYMGNIIAERCYIYFIGIEILKHLLLADIKAPKDLHFGFMVALAELFYLFLGKNLKPGYLERFNLNPYKVIFINGGLHLSNNHFYSFMAVKHLVHACSVLVAVNGKLDIKTVKLPLAACF